MIGIFVTVIILFFLLLTPFLFKKFSPIPYFPTNRKDMPLIMNTITLKDNQVFFDLGAGDGIIVFELAKKSQTMKLDTQFVAIELNPILVFILHIRRLLHTNRNNIIIIWGDMFTYDYKSYVKNKQTEFLFYLYISPWFLEQATTVIRSLDMPVHIISYFYPIHSLKASEKKLKGIHTVYNYEV